MEQKLLTYTKKEKWIFLTSIIGQNILYGIFANTFAYFLQFTLLIPAAAVGTMMGVARVFDAVNDPVMGYIADRTHTKWGKFRPYLAVAPLFILLVTIMCFMSPFGVYTHSSSPALVLVWSAIGYVLWDLAYTLGDIPLWGITSLMTEDNNDRNKLLSSARVVCAVGIGLGYVVQPIALAIAGKTGDEPAGFLMTATAFALVGAAMFQLAVFGVKERVKPPVTKAPGVLHSFKLMWSNKPFRQIILSGILGSPKMLIMVVSLPLMTYYFAAKSFVSVVVYMGLIGIGLFVGQYIAMSFVPKLLTKFSKKQLFNYSNLIAVLPCLIIFGLYLLSPMNMTAPVNLALMAVCFTLIGIGLGIPVVLLSILIADCVDYQEYLTGERPDGIFFSGQSFVAKFQAAMAAFIAGIGYSYVGFSDVEIERVNAFISNGGIPRTEPAFAPYMMILFFLITIPPAIGYLLSVIPMWNYALDTDVHNHVVEELNKRRHEEQLAIDN